MSRIWTALASIFSLPESDVETTLPTLLGYFKDPQTTPEYAGLIAYTMMARGLPGIAQLIATCKDLLEDPRTANDLRARALSAFDVLAKTSARAPAIKGMLPYYLLPLTPILIATAVQNPKYRSLIEECFKVMGWLGVTALQEYAANAFRANRTDLGLMATQLLQQVTQDTKK